MGGWSKVLQPRSRVVVVSSRQLLAPDGGPTTRNGCVLEARVSGGIHYHIDEEYLAEYETTIFPNGKNPSPEAEEAIARTFRENRELGHTAARPPLGGAEYVATPVRAEPKRDGGVDVPGKFGPVQNLSKAGEVKRSVNGGVPEENSKIKFKMVEDAAENTILMKRRTGDLINVSKFDQKAAYRLLPIHPAHVGLLGFRDNESPPGEWIELWLPFDLASACRTSTTFCKSTR
jgi:hypothetical protein